MRIVEDAWRREDWPRRTVVAVGNFDGLHRGQQLIVERVRDRARALGVPAVVVTFEPHPLAVLRPERPPQRITTPHQKHALLSRMGIDLVAIVRFTPEFATTPADTFVEKFLCRGLGVVELYVGSRFGFGRGREGDLGRLRQLAERLDFRVEGMAELNAGSETISSTRIRQAVRAGRVTEAGELLGRPYSITGSVVRGEGRGKRHGWPTINIDPDHELLPSDGVYVAQVWLPPRTTALGAVTNIGRRPTFPGDDRRVVEAHLFDFDQDLHGDRVELGFLERLRGERRFHSVEALASQIGQDAQRAREYLAKENCSELLPTLLE